MVTEKGCAYCDYNHRCPNAFSAVSVHCGEYDHAKMFTAETKKGEKYSS